MPKLSDADSSDDISHEESKVEQDVHAKEQVNGELFDELEHADGKTVRTKAEEAQEDEDEDSEGPDEDEFEVQEIVNHKFIKRDILYYVHWKGYDSKKDYTWEPTDNILPGARDKLAEYHHKIGGDPAQSLKKAKSTSSLRKKSSVDEDSPPPKKRKLEDTQWEPKRQDWEPDVDKIENIERDALGQLLVFVLFKNGKKIKVSMDKIYKHCPRPMLKFYESHLHFKSAEVTAPGS